MQAKGQPRVRPLLHDGEPLFVQPRGRSLQRHAGGATVETRRPAPEPERGFEGGCRLVEAAGLRGGTSGRRDPLEDMQIQLVVPDFGEVSGRPGLDDIGQPDLRHAGADDRDTDLDLGACGGRRGHAPDGVDEVTHRNDPIGLQQQNRQNDALALGGDQRWATGADDFQRPE